VHRLPYDLVPFHAVPERMMAMIDITLRRCGCVADTAYITDKLTSELDLLERHILMLKITRENQPIGIIRLSELLGIPKHKVRYSLRLLEQARLIQPSTDGARVTDDYDDFMSGAAAYLDALVSRIGDIRNKVPRTTVFDNSS